MAESVDETGGKEVANTLAFGVGKARIFRIVFGSGKIDWSMSGVEITTNHDWFLFFQKLKMFEEGWIPEIFAEPETREIGFAVGDVDVDEEKIRKFDGLQTAFAKGRAVLIFVPGIARLETFWKRIGDAERSDFGKNCGTRITWAVGTVPNFSVCG